VAEKFLHQLWDAKTMANDDIPALYRKIFTHERYKGDDVVALGRFLFDRLLGQETWDAICTAAGTADFVELALRFDAQRYDLHRFPWELLHDGHGFLAHGFQAQGQPPACVTRLIKREETEEGAPPPAQPRQFERPARLLFAVGADLTDRRIRPGAEILGLLRQLQARGLIVRARVARSVSPIKLNEIVRQHKPDLVHFVCHGSIRPVDGKPSPRGFLEFKSDDKKTPVKYRSADDLLGDLQDGSNGTVPPVVVLSACYTGVVPVPNPQDPEKTVDVEEHRAAGVDRIGSLAAELVHGGVPVVVGMGGRVSDSACRLFTRFFGQAVLEGESLIAAVARGRRAAFLWGTSQTADWAFPALFLAEGVDHAYKPMSPASATDPCKTLAQRIQAFGVPRHPVFCGRHEFFERYELLFRAGEPPFLPIFTKDTTPGLGRTRLLQELAAKALRDGHIPCLVSSDETGWPPPFDEVSELAALVLKFIDETRKNFGLPPPYDSSVLAAILEAKQVPDWQAKQSGLQKRSQFRSLIDQAIKAEGSGPSADVCHTALQEDFQALIDEARSATPPLAGPESRVVLLLDNVHNYGKAIGPLLRDLIREFGLGIATEPVPVILCYALGTPAGDEFTKDVESITKHAIELKPFSDLGDEDLLAYEQVLLFPDKLDRNALEFTDFVRTRLQQELEGQVASYAFNHRAGAGDRDTWIQQFRWGIKGIPGLMRERRMQETAVGAFCSGVLVLGDDEARLAKL
jgi:hypothetical protein